MRLVHSYNSPLVNLINMTLQVADIPIDHPSCSKQHAAIQYRQVQVRDEWGGSKAEVK